MFVVLCHCDLGYLVAKVSVCGNLCPERRMWALSL